MFKMNLNKTNIPSFKIHLTSACFVTSPGITVITMSLSSSVRITFWKPHNASTSSMFKRKTRSFPDRLNTYNRETYVIYTIMNSKWKV